MRRRNLRGAFVFAGAAAALSACGAGGGASVPPAPAQAQSGWKNTAQLSLSFPVPVSPSNRKPAFVSPSARSMQVTVNSVDGGAPPAWVAPNPSVVNFATSGSNANCTLSHNTETCTINVPAPPGSVSYTLTLFDAANAAGNELGTVTQTLTIAQGQTTPIDVTIQGIVASVAVSAHALSPSTSVPGSVSFEALTVQAKDADGNTITGSSSDALANSVQLTVSDQMHATSLYAGPSASCPGSTSVTLTSPQEPVWLCYTGEATANVSITANVGGGGSILTALNPISLTGTTSCTVSVGCAITDPNYNAPTVFFTTTAGAAATQTLTAAELGWTQSPYNQQFDLTLDPASCGTGSSAVVSTPANPAVSWTLTALHPGICKGTLIEHTAAPLHASGTAVWFSVTNASVTGS